VEVTGGSVSYLVRLATTRRPGGEDSAIVAPGTTVVLRTADVAWGETIDGRLEFEARDGSGTQFVDELEHYSFTRPTEEDCAAVHDPTLVHPSPPPSSSPSPSRTGQAPAPTEPGTTAPPSRTPGGSATTTPSHTPAPEPEETGAAGGPAGPSGAASTGRVVPGDRVTVDGAGFLPGERVVVQLDGGPVLGTVTAADDGTVRAQVTIPEGTRSGRMLLSLVGDDSDVVAAVELRVAAASAPEGDGDLIEVVPLALAAAALVGATAGVVSAAGQRRRRPLDGSA
jgi:hypothetical protein